MKIKIIQTFDGWPTPGHDEDRWTRFTAGDEVDVPDDFANLVIGNGQAAAASPAAPSPTAPKPQTPPVAPPPQDSDTPTTKAGP